MKKTLSVLLCILITLSLVSCTLSLDGASSVPTVADPESDQSFSSKIESEISSFISSIETSSEGNVSGFVESYGQSSSKDDSFLPQSSSQASSNGTSSSKPPISSETEASSEASSTKPVSSETETSSTVSKPTSSESVSTPEEKPQRLPLKKEQYYCYSRLNELQKKAYDKILNAADVMPSGFIELGDADIINEKDVYLVAITLKNDHPEIFWLPYAWYIGETHNGQMAILFANDVSTNVGGDIESFTATYVVERAKKLKMEAELAAAVKEIKSQVTATDPYGIELQLHDILCERITYSKIPTPISYTAYGALVEGSAMCEGYARALQLLLYEFGINSTLITGYAGQEHMWNLVEIDGKWYHTDLTWDDQNSGIRHSYFNLTDQAISKDHIINSDFETLTTNQVVYGEPFNYSLPICNSTVANYYEKTGFMLPRDLNRLADGIVSGKIKSAEVIGWNEEVKNNLDKTIKSRGYNHELKFLYEESWAKITVTK